MHTRGRIVCLAAAAGSAAAAALAIGAPGAVTTVAGLADIPGFEGDGGPASAAVLNFPTGVAMTPDGGYLIADQDNNRVRRVSPSGVITTVAGTGVAGDGGDGGPAAAAELASPTGVAATADGGVLIADTANGRIRRVSPSGVITTVAGNGQFGFAGDGGPATDALLDRPAGVAATPGGGFLVVDTFNNRIRRVSPSGVITTVAGNGQFGFAGDGGPATDAELNLPSGTLATPDGGFLVADQGNHVVRRVSPVGTIATVAGSTPGFSGDGGRATMAQLDAPSGVALDGDGGFVVVDQDNNRLRRVGRDGVIVTLGAGAVADGTELTVPFAAAVTPDGDVLVADAASHRVRIVDANIGPRPEAAGAAAGRVRIVALRAWRADGTVRVRFRLTGRARVSLAVRPSGGVPLRVAARTLAPGVGTLVWSGRLRGRRAGHGPYTLVITATAGADRATTRVRVRL